MGNRPRNWGRSALIGLLAAAAGAAHAHKSSDAYLQIAAAPGKLEVRSDIALRDLDVVLDLDTDADGKLTWGEVRAAWPRIEAYAMQHIAIEGCPLRPTGRGLERRNDGAYAVLYLQSSCTLPEPPKIIYSLFADVDPTHRGIAKIQRPGEALRLLVLEPGASRGVETRAASAPVSGAATANGGANRSEGAPRWAFLVEGVRHILGGYDHVLFLLCLLLPSVMRRTATGWQPVERLSQAVWPVVGIVSAFTVAHSITLCLAALKIVSLTSAFIEPAIAVTIMLAAADNIWPIFPVRRVVVTFFFGLIHGFGFASVLSELNLPTADFAWALLQFNVGLELGQLLVVGLATAVLFGLRGWRSYRAFVIRGGSAVALGIAGLWLVERTADMKILPF
ncbi:MAG: HupE/UreJ family protein [Pseudomonadota bacterium]|nr:HupE/UreJ family protein [Pseudomonadota bacterium]